MSDTLVIIDYGSGNLRSAAKSFEKVIQDDGLNMDVKISSHAEDLRSASHIVLPGQGAFGDCMTGLQNVEGMVEALEETVLQHGKPFFGICVGMQLLASRGLEHGDHKGLGWIEGEVVPMQPADPALKIPHMGWNTITLCNDRAAQNGSAATRVRPHVADSSAKASAATEHLSQSKSAAEMLCCSISSSKHYYFVHSFMFKCKEKQHILATANYGGEVAAIVGRDNVIGTQFHPEKSQTAGLELLSAFVHWKP